MWQMDNSLLFGTCVAGIGRHIFGALISRAVGFLSTVREGNKGVPLLAVSFGSLWVSGEIRAADTSSPKILQTAGDIESSHATPLPPPRRRQEKRLCDSAELRIHASSAYTRLGGKLF